MINLKDEPNMEHQTSTCIDYEKDLNPAQLEAVTVPSGPVLVIAGAGSGKTRTIVYRVAWLVEHGIDPASILLLTFTRKAAEEMLNRAAQLLDSRVSKVSGGTFHSTGNLLLRRYAGLVGFDSSFSIMDQADSFEILEHLRKSLIAPEDLKGFPKSRTISEVVSRAIGGGEPIGVVLERRYPHFVHYAGDLDKIRALYEEHKRGNNLMDYDDLLVNPIRLLEENEHVRRDVSTRWQHILVDEYQDTNKLQARIVRLLAYVHDNVMVVGDDSQSIYSFRGADFTNIMEFPKAFKNTRVIRLEENYRSTAPILTVTNSIIERAVDGYPKRLFTRKAGGPLPLAARSSTEREQSRFVVRCIKELREHGIPLKEVAVLFRAGFHSFDLEGELMRNNIPFVKHGGFKFLESMHIKDVLAHLKVLNNQKDRLAWMRILRLLPGVGIKTALKLAGRIADEGIPASASDLLTGDPKYRPAFEGLVQLIADLTNHQGPISEKVERINLYYFPFLKEMYDNYPKRMRDLEHLADLTAPYRSLHRFLNDMALEPPDEERSSLASQNDNLVLSTIHSAKGLEWHTVILIWAAEGRIPSPMALDSSGELEEERRLLYVATTRAKHNLVVVAPLTLLDRRLGQVSVRLSRFFEEVPAEYFRAYSV
ncbi:MAG: ATP-dependent helicase [Desulfomonilaceae bacterium]